MPRPVIYYVRHGLTDWNVQHRLQGRHDVPLNALGRAQAVRCGEILHDLFLRDGGKAEDLDYVSSPLDPCADNHGNHARDSRLGEHAGMASIRGLPRFRSVNGKV